MVSELSPAVSELIVKGSKANPNAFGVDSLWSWSLVLAISELGMEQIEYRPKNSKIVISNFQKILLE